MLELRRAQQAMDGRLPPNRRGRQERRLASIGGGIREWSGYSSVGRLHRAGGAVPRSQGEDSRPPSAEQRADFPPAAGRPHTPTGKGLVQVVLHHVAEPRLKLRFLGLLDPRGELLLWPRLQRAELTALAPTVLLAEADVDEGYLAPLVEQVRLIWRAHDGRSHRGSQEEVSRRFLIEREGCN